MQLTTPGGTRVQPGEELADLGMAAHSELDRRLLVVVLVDWVICSVATSLAGCEMTR